MVNILGLYTANDLLIFLKSLAIEAYNKRFKCNFNIDDFSFTLLEPRTFSFIGYELQTTNEDSQVIRFKVFLSIDKYNTISSIQLETLINVDGVGNLNDEIYILTGSIEEYIYIQYTKIKKDLIRILGNYLFSDDGFLLLTDNNEPIFIE